MIVNNLDIIGNEHLSRAHCNLKAEFRDGRYSINQNFILCLGSIFFQVFIVKLSISKSYWTTQYERESYGGSTSWERKAWGRLFLCHSDWIEILGRMVHYPSAIYVLIHILQKFPAGYCLCNNLPSRAALFLPKIGRLKLKISLIS